MLRLASDSRLSFRFFALDAFGRAVFPPKPAMPFLWCISCVFLVALFATATLNYKVCQVFCGLARFDVLLSASTFPPWRLLVTTSMADFNFFTSSNSWKFSFSKKRTLSLWAARPARAHVRHRPVSLSKQQSLRCYC